MNRFPEVNHLHLEYAQLCAAVDHIFSTPRSSKERDEAIAVVEAFMGASITRRLKEQGSSGKRPEALHALNDSISTPALLKRQI